MSWHIAEITRYTFCACSRNYRIAQPSLHGVGWSSSAAVRVRPPRIREHCTPKSCQANNTRTDIGVYKRTRRPREVKKVKKFFFPASHYSVGVIPHAIDPLHPGPPGPVLVGQIQVCRQPRVAPPDHVVDETRSSPDFWVALASEARMGCHNAMSQAGHETIYTTALELEWRYSYSS